VKLHKIAFVLLVIGGLNWLLQGLLNKDLFVLLGMDMGSWVPRIVYILVGLSALSEVMGHKKLCKMCDKGAAM
jgi:uncharacterized membrane protein YuzA (DUF378 family)